MWMSNKIILLIIKVFMVIYILINNIINAWINNTPKKKLKHIIKIKK